MAKKNTVFIATSLDGFIADSKGGINWLNTVPNPDNNDMGFFSLMNRIDAIVMGKTTFEKVLSFDVEWPYPCPVVVLSTSLKEIPEGYEDKIILTKGTVEEVLLEAHDLGYEKLYIDGGRTIQSFLQADKIDELIVSKIPILLGGGFPLFTTLESAQNFNHDSTEVFLEQIVQSTYKRKK